MAVLGLLSLLTYVLAVTIVARHFPSHGFSQFFLLSPLRTLKTTVFPGFGHFHTEVVVVSIPDVSEGFLAFLVEYLLHEFSVELSFEFLALLAVFFDLSLLDTIISFFKLYTLLIPVVELSVSVELVAEVLQHRQLVFLQEFGILALERVKIGLFSR